MGIKGQKLFDDNLIIKYDKNILYENEILLEISPNIVPGIYGYYAISNYGRVYHKYLERFISPGLSGSGYLFVELSTEFGVKPVQIHRLVLMTFNNIEHPELFDVNHIDGCKTNNILYNLEWCTRSENQKHAYRIGLHKNTNVIINENIAFQICELLAKEIYTNKQIADILGPPITDHIVSDIKKKISWRNVSKDYTFNHRPGKKFSEELINNICIYFQNNPIGNLNVNNHCRNALRFYGYDDSDEVVDCLRKVYKRKYYTSISKNYIF